MALPLVFLDRAKETTTTTGSGALSLAGPVAGFIALSGVGDGSSTYYTITEGDKFEVGCWNLYECWEYFGEIQGFIQL